MRSSRARSSSFGSVPPPCFLRAAFSSAILHTSPSFRGKETVGPEVPKRAEERREEREAQVRAKGNEGEHIEPQLTLADAQREGEKGGGEEETVERVEQVRQGAAGAAAQAERAQAVERGTNFSEELGDVLFAAVKAGRFLNVDPEDALNATCEKFIARFRRVEEACAARGAEMSSLPLDELTRLWNEAKHPTE